MNLNFEPVALAAAVRALLACAVAFGLDFTAEQVAAAVVAVEVVTGLFVRAKVTPNAKIVTVDTPEEAFNLLTAGQEQDWTVEGL